MAIILIMMELAWAYAAVIVRHMEKITHYEANFNFGLILSILTGLMLPYNIENSFRKDYLLFLKSFIISGLVLALSQACFMEALLLTEKKGMIAMIGFLGVVFSYLLSIVRYN